MAYGKALSTYKRINKIKRSSENIMEAQSLINQKRAESIDKARELQRRQRMTGAVSNAVQTGVAFEMSRSNNIDPETASRISTGIGGISAIGTNLISGAGISQNDFLGLSTEEYRNIVEQQNPDIAGGAISGFALQDSLNEIRRRKEASESIKGFSEEERMGFSENELMQHIGEVEFEKGVGFDFGRLPEIAKRIETERAIRMGTIPRSEVENINQPNIIERPDLPNGETNVFDVNDFWQTKRR